MDHFQKYFNVGLVINESVLHSGERLYVYLHFSHQLHNHERLWGLGSTARYLYFSRSALLTLLWLTSPLAHSGMLNVLG